MKSIINKITHIFLILCLITMNLFYYKVDAAEEKTFGQVKKELENYKAEYEANKEKQKLTENEKASIRTNIKNTEEAISSSQDEIYQLKLAIEELNKNISEKEAEIDTILSFYQVSTGESVYLEYAFGAATFTDFIYRVAVAEQLTSYNASLVTKFKNDIEESNKKQEELTIKIADLEVKQQQLAKDLVRLSDELEELSDDAVSIEREIELAQSQIDLFKQLGCSDNETMTACAESKMISDTGFYRPLKEGHLTGFPGYRCILGSCSTHHGLDMSNYGADTIDYSVYSVANGIVLATYDERACGGKKVYIQHNIKGVIYTSAYWHLRRIDVKKGQVVTKDTQIGIMGGTESWDRCTTGAHLHLELSTAKFNENYYYSTRANWLKPQQYINFPSSTYVHWTNRYTKY